MPKQWPSCDAAVRSRPAPPCISPARPDSAKTESFPVAPAPGDSTRCNHEQRVPRRAPSRSHPPAPSVASPAHPKPAGTGFCPEGRAPSRCTRQPQASSHPPAPGLPGQASVPKDAPLPVGLPNRPIRSHRGGDSIPPAIFDRGRAGFLSSDKLPGIFHCRKT
jgi:hypothetical protein